MQIGQYIASNGGVVTAEELAPYLDVENADKTVRHSFRHILHFFLNKNKIINVGHNYIYNKRLELCFTFTFTTG